MPRKQSLLACWLALTLAALTSLSSAQTPPATEKKPVTDEYHGTPVIDPYRWLEDTTSAAVKKWFREQNRHTRNALAKLPARELIRRRLQELYENQSSYYDRLMLGQDRLFAVKDEVLITLSSVDKPDSERVLVDPEEALPGKNAMIDFFVPTFDDKLVAVCLSTQGAEEGTVYVYDTATGKKRAEVIPRVSTASGGSLAWKADNSGFYYTCHPLADKGPLADRNAYQQVYFHKLGTPIKEDKYVFGKDLPRLAGITLGPLDEKQVLIAVNLGTDIECEYYLLGDADKPKLLTRFADEVTACMLGLDGNLYCLSQHKAPRGQLVKVPLDKPDLAKAETVVPQGDGVLSDYLVTEKRIFVVDHVQGSYRLRVFDLKGKEQKPVPIKPLSNIRSILELDDERLLFQVESFLEPPAWMKFNPATGKVTRTPLSTTSPADFSDTEVVRETATSKDGTKVPLTILRRKGTKRDGSSPTLLYGYGGYGEHEGPSFDAARRIWLEQGGVWAVAHPRGDGEFGTDWHRAGKLIKKQNVFDDFLACAKHLIEQKYTSPEKLAVEGGSNGGLLVGAALTQQPELFRAAISRVGVYDMLRFEQEPNGTFSTTEFGSVKDREQFKTLLAYSPYHRVEDGKQYPAVFLLTGANDNRVLPWQTWKMAARLQASGSKQPVLLWTGVNAGHNIVQPGEELNRLADEYALLFDQLGVKYKPAR
jgi:prolyl oligopeptidase